MSLPSRTSSVSSSDGRPDLSAIGKILGAGDDSQVPKLGKTRCYWALLTSDLDFLYLDPVLQHHMGPEHQVMLGTSLLSYLHPAELEQARKDLRGIVDSGTLFGSVTRVRFARLSHMRKLLGANEPEVPENAATFCSDDKFIALDLVINAAGEGLVLAFFHSIIDKQQKDDQDELRKSEWTNWCGTPFITQDMIKLLWEKVSTVHLPPLPRAPAFPPQRVFQIHLASSEHEILLTHPPARPMPLNDGPPLLDGGYQEEEFQRLLEQISLNPQGGSPFSEAKTTCTRRFRAKHTLLTEGCFRTIESVFIPYGTLIFACFQTKHQEWLPPSAGPQAGPRPPQIGYNSQQQHQHQQQQQQLAMNHSNQHNASPYPPPPPANHSWNSQPAAAIGYGGAPPWPGTPVASTTSSNGPSGYGYSVSSSYGGDQHPYRVHHQHQQPGPPPPQQQQQQHQPPHVLPPPPTDGYSQQWFESTSPPPGPEFSQDDHHDSAQEGTNGSPSSQNPVPRKAAIPITRPNKSMRGGSGGGSLSASGLPKLPEQLRNGGKPPKGISCCASCGTTDSAEWRKGESGQKDLCNACGLRYARIVAKQSGKVRARKKKDKNGNDIQPKQLPPSSTAAATSSSNNGRSDSDGSSGQPPAKKARARGAASTTPPLPPPSVPGPLTDGPHASSSYPGAELTSPSMSYHHSGHPLSNSPYPASGSYRPSPHHAAFQLAPPPPPPLPPSSSHPSHPYPAALAQPHDSYAPSPQQQQQHAAYAQPPPPAHHHPYNGYEAAPGPPYKPYGGGPGGGGGQPHQPHRPHPKQQPHQAGIPPPLQQYPPHHPTPPPPHPPPPQQQQQQSSYSPYGGGHPNFHPTQPHPQAHRQQQQPLHHPGGYQPPPPPPISNGGGYSTYTNNGNGGGGYDRHRLQHHQSQSDGGGPGPASHQYPGMGYAQPGYGPGPGSYASGGRGESGPRSAGERAG